MTVQYINLSISKNLRLGLDDCIAVILVSHETYVKTLSSTLNQTKYSSYWMIRGSWDPLGVIESYMNPKFDLYKGMEDFSCLLERVGLLRLTQADTERVVKTIRKIEPRFPSFNEVKEAKGARDRAQQEIFLCENKVALQELPLDALFDVWTQTHYPTLKKKAGNSKSVETFFKKDVSSAKFMNS